MVRIRPSGESLANLTFSIVVGQREHVSAVCCASERPHPELDSETKYHLRNRLVVVTGDLGYAWFQEDLAISGK